MRSFSFRRIALWGALLPCLLWAQLPERGVVRHATWAAVGRARVLDTYLSPQEYAGPSFGLVHFTDRRARWGRGRVSVQGLYTGHVACLGTSSVDGREWEALLSGAVAWHYNWFLARGLRLGVGPMAELATGVTYNARNGNNPAQGRLDAAVGLSAVAGWRFRLWRQPFSCLLRADVPLVGAMFTPAYGQSYYEIFTLGHYDRNVRATHPFNAPSARLLAALRIPVAGATLSLGYLGDVRQADVAHLKRHLWNHQFMIGYERTLRLLRPRR